MQTNVPHRPKVRTESQLQATFDRALAKSAEQAQAGNLPRLLHTFDMDDGQRQVWSVASRTLGGTVYLLDTLTSPTGAVDVLCECPSSGWCWHRTHVERAIAGEIGHFAVPAAPPPPRLSNDDIFGPAA
jgi:hypothetical protein